METLVMDKLFCVYSKKYKFEPILVYFNIVRKKLSIFSGNAKNK